MFRKQLFHNFFSSILYRIIPFPKCNLRFIIKIYKSSFFFSESELNEQEGERKRRKKKENEITDLSGDLATEESGGKVLVNLERVRGK